MHLLSSASALLLFCSPLLPFSLKPKQVPCSFSAPAANQSEHTVYLMSPAARQMLPRLERCLEADLEVVTQWPQGQGRSLEREAGYPALDTLWTMGVLMPMPAPRHIFPLHFPPTLGDRWRETERQRGATVLAGEAEASGRVRPDSGWGAKGAPRGRRLGQHRPQKDLGSREWCGAGAGGGVEGFLA